ncbi:mitochondrial chaperone BCS1 [Brevipalpus obovatus]|uniref:mitochondrial chaperone BCS1 n=1 Tax=Brevipalpus obovatus TaxID=246614 RepID=UPI003D9E060E
MGVVGELVTNLLDNPYFGAGAGLFGVGVGAALLRRTATISKLIFQRNFLVTLEVPCQDKSFPWLMQWITRNATKAQHLEVQTFYEQRDSGKIETKFDFVPSEGIHYMVYLGRLIKIERTRGQTADITNYGKPWESIKLTTWGMDKNNIFFPMLEEAKSDALANYEGKTVMYIPRGHEWIEFGQPRKRRSLSSVILKRGLGEGLFADVQEFIDSPCWYSDRGVPYRRGYLLYGPPGCGKTSFITAIAGQLEYSICALNLSERGLTDDRLNHLMNVAPSQSIILLEDVDAAFMSREESEKSQLAYDGLNRLTFSGLLNMLDGVASSEARILFMTTNYIERLDPALIRPGRVDVKQYIGHAEDDQVIRAFRKFYPDSPENLAMEFCTVLRESLKQPVSVALLQGYFLLHKHSPEDALKNVDDIKNKVK